MSDDIRDKLHDHDKRITINEKDIENVDKRVSNIGSIFRWGSLAIGSVFLTKIVEWIIQGGLRLGL